MKSKILFSVIVGIISITTSSTVYAQSAELNSRAQVKFEVGNTARSGATSTQARENSGTTTKEVVSTTTASKHSDEAKPKRSKGAQTADEYRSAVATFVQSLIAVADRNGGIGTEVREVAQSQNESASTTAQAIDTIEKRGNFRTFFAGSDYKNIGVIRSELATTTAHIAQLQRLLEKTTVALDRTEITNQIDVLKEQQEKLQSYITAQEDVFSLFGWLNRLLVK